MKTLVLTLVVGVAALASATLATPAGLAGGRCPERPTDQQALLTIRRLPMFRQPVANEFASGKVDKLATGPIWDPYYTARPGSGKTMVIDAHDVTPVPCYGAHGPFYHLNSVKPGDLATINYHGALRTYRFVTYPFAKRQCASKKINNSAAHLIDNIALCAPYNKPIKTKWHIETVYFRMCWPRYTRRDFLYERAVLIKTQPAP